MKYLLDTNICIYLIKKQPASVIARFGEHTVGDIGVSTITVSELAYGVEKSSRLQANRQALAQFLAPLVIAEYDAEAAFAYGKIRAGLEQKGTPIGALDILIAGQALGMGVTLVTNKAKEFERVKGLAVENWI